MPHRYVILGKPITTTNSKRIVWIPTKKKELRAPGEEVQYRPMILASKAFSQWKKNAEPQFVKQRGSTPTIECVCDVRLDIYRQINQGDAGNYNKGILDQMERLGIIRNDRLFKSVTEEKWTDPKNPRVEIVITERPHTGFLFDLPDPELPEEMEEHPTATVDDLPVEFLTPEERAERAARKS